MYCKIDDVNELFVLAKQMQEDVKKLLVKLAEKEAIKDNISRYEVAEKFNKFMYDKEINYNLRFYIKVYLYKNKYYFEIIVNTYLNIYFNGIYDLGQKYYKKYKKVRYESNIHNALDDIELYCKFDILSPDNWYLMKPNNSVNRNRKV